jgi:ABC-type antimicrobial peptide transport system permease subunit
MLGIYGVVAYVVGLRRPEFGVRLALGASGGRLRLMVLARALATTTAGLASGLLIAAGSSRLLRTFLYGVDTVDPLTYGLASGLLLVAAGAAAYFPARSASRVAPSEALRAN